MIRESITASLTEKFIRSDPAYINALARVEEFFRTNSSALAAHIMKDSWFVKNSWFRKCCLKQYINYYTESPKAISRCILDD